MLPSPVEQGMARNSDPRFRDSHLGFSWWWESHLLPAAILSPLGGTRKVESRATNRVCSPVAEEAGVTGSILTECG